MSSETIFIAGRYNKYSRNLSQSPWIDKNDVRVKDSVQELIEEGLHKFLEFEKSIFATSGREDVDVCMLGKGRPFAFKIHNPSKLDQYNVETFKLISEFINEKHANKIKVSDLQLAPKSDVSKYISEGQEDKKKEYRALCCCTKKISDIDIDRINTINDLVIEQKTPIRVLHRRTWAVRRRTIHNLKIETVDLNEFDNIKKDDLEHVFTIRLLTESGTYIKEFVHGDFGRTQPNLASLIGDCETDLMELDVMEVHLDWPPSIEDNNPRTLSMNLDIRDSESTMPRDDVALCDLYTKGYKLMQDSLVTARGEKRQDMMIESRRCLQHAMNLIESLSVFSDNETLDDIATENLKFILIPAYLAKLSLSGEIGSQRLETFTRAEALIKQFLRSVSTYGLADERVDRALRSIDNPDTQAAFPISASLQDQARIRAEKIERLNETLKLEERLTELERRIQTNQDIDIETHREFYISMIKKWIHDSLEDYERVIVPALAFERGTSRSDHAMSTSLKSNKTSNVLPKSFTIVKDDLQKRVFGVGYPALPSVSVDEFITKKLSDGDLAFQSHKEIYANSLQRYAEQPDLRREQEEQSDEEREKKEEREDEEELARKRKWDEFKDETPRGSGNRHNMG